MYKKFIHFFKQDAVFTISLILAVISCFFVQPSAEYIGYIDFRVLALLFCLMTVIGGYSNIGFFHKLGKTLLNKAASIRSLAAVLVFLCFFSSMVITNDVALITFVPFTILILNMIHRNDKLILLIVLETIAANLGSMLTPLGNPQNLYLYTISGMNLGEFVLTLLPYTAISFLLLAILIWRFPKEAVSIELDEDDTSVISKGKLIIYTGLFLLCLLVVLHIFPFQLVLAIVFIVMLFTDRKVLYSVDYILLLTFVCFFIFIGNMKNIPAVHTLLSQIISGHEFASGVLASQCISNVPAAILLSGFTTEIAPLLIGVNVGGLGTLIASLASLISYKYYTKAISTSSTTIHNTKTSSPLTQTASLSTPNTSGRYMYIFTAYNVLFLAILVAAYYLLTLLP